jgi:3-deoxy-manno-octulosonate cytidylyltransferase (CMP-KDO synthetase)
MIATDSKEIYDHTTLFNAKTIMTNKNHISGTDRCNEVVSSLNIDYDLIINVQADEPLINPKQIDKIIDSFKVGSDDIISLAKEITSDKEIHNPNTVKVNFNKEMFATEFYRDLEQESLNYYKHIGIYAFKKGILQKLCALSPSESELKLKLEQLRWMDNNYKIKILETNFESISIDTKDDLNNLLEYYKKAGN